MAITFKGERTVAELNNDLGGFVKDSAFRIYDHGILSKGDVPVKHGDFVSWTGTQWKIEPSLEYATSADVEAVEEQVEALGKPLQWKGPATVSELNAGISGIQPGWTYTLTDAGTLTDGGIDVEVGDEVAWTEDDEWFKVGGDSGKVEVIQVSWDTDHFTYPTYSEIDAIVHTKKKGLCLLVQNPGGSKDCWWVSGKSAASANNYYKFLGVRGEELYIYQDGTDKRKYPVVKTSAIAPDYDPSQTYPTVGTAVMQYGTRYVSNTAITTAEEWTPAHWTEKSVEDEIGNVEALLAAL